MLIGQALAGEVIGGRFKLERVVGSGGMGTVWSAEDLLKGERVALKLLHNTQETEKRRLLREADALRGIEHPAIVGYVAHGEHDGRGWLAMEWLQGSDLARRLAHGPLDVAELMRLARNLAEALAVLHEHGLVHRDIKPANIFLEGGDTSNVRIVDFGLAKSQRLENITAVGQIIGTVGYMAPEQLRLQPLDARTDVFALGCVLWECASGRARFEGTPSAIVMKILLEPSPRIDALRPEVGEAFASLLARMMDRDPSQRPCDARMVVAELAEIGGVQGHGEHPSRLSSAQRTLAALALVSRATELAPKGAQAVIREHGARVEAELARAWVLSFDAGAHVEPQLVSAARCALTLCRLAGVTGVSLALVHREPEGVGRAVDTIAARADLAVESRGVWLDDAIERLLPARFERTLGRSGWLLEGERDGLDLPRLLLGRPSPFVERDAELDALVSAVLGAERERRFAGVVVSGEAGVGKSRLRQEALRRLADKLPQLSVLVVRGDASLVDSPLGALARTIRRLAHVDGSSLAEDERRLAERVARHVPAQAAPRVARVLGELVGVGLAHRTADAAGIQARLPSDGDETGRALLTFLAAEAWAGAVLVIVEDAHAVDRATLALLALAARELQASRLSYWLLGRREHAAPLLVGFEDLALRELALGPLTEAGASALAKALLPSDAVPARVDAIVRAGRGQPQLIEELVRAEVDSRVGAPSALVALIEARLEDLASEARRVLAAASLVGQTFWIGAVRALIDDPVETIVEQLDQLVALDWLVERSPSRFAGERELAFRSEAERGAALACLTAEDRVVGHGIVGRWLETVHEPDAALIASQFARGGILHVAAVYYAHAVRSALSAGDFQLALELARRGSSCAPDPSTHAWLALLSARARRFRGEHARAREAAEEALATLSGTTLSHHDRFYEAAAEVASAAFRQRDVERLQQIAEALERTTLNSEPRPVQVAMAARVAGLLALATPAAVARPLFDWLDQHERGFDSEPAVVGAIAAARGLRAARRGQWADCRRLSLIALESYEKASDFRRAALLRVNAGQASLELGRFAEAERLLSAALSSSEAQSLLPAAALSRLYLGVTLERLGRHDEGIACERAAVRAFEVEHDTRLEGCARLELGRMLLGAGRADDAEAEARRALMQLAGVRSLELLARALLADVLRARGDVAGALENARAAVAGLEANDAAPSESAAVWLALAEALIKAGIQAEASVALGRAQGDLERAAGLIEDEAMRADLESASRCRARVLALRAALGSTAFPTLP